jgi:ketosteroid isomerase-like protein
MVTIRSGLVLVGLALGLGAGALAAAAPSRADETAAVAKVIRTSIEWAATKDTLALYDCFADPDLFFFNPDTKSTIGSTAAFRADVRSFFMDPRFAAVRSRFDDLRIHLSKGGDVAWYSCRLTDHNTWDGRPADWDDVRWTGVLEKRVGRWKIVQMHFSKDADRVAAETRGGAPFGTWSGPYLGQEPPGATPELFAPGLISGATAERDIAITPDGREIYFGILQSQGSTIMVTRRVDGHWTEPVAASFAADRRWHHFEPALSADGNRMIFLCTRPTAGEEAKPGWGNQNLFVADRRPDGSWGEPRDLGAPVNTTDHEFFPSLTRDGTLYFTRSRPRTGRTVIVRSRLVDGRYQPPDTLPAAVNGHGSPYNAFVAPDESYLIACVDGRDDGAEPGRAQYFVFFRDAADRWSEGVCLGPTVSPGNGNAGSAYVSPDGRYLFFGAARTDEESGPPDAPRTLRELRERQARARNGNPDIYWVDASLIGRLRPAPAR